MNVRLSRRSDIIKFILILIAVSVIVLLCVRDAGGRPDMEYVRAGGRDISIYRSDDKDYLFVPGYVDEDKIRRSREYREYEPEIVRYTGLPTIFIDTASGSIDKILEDKEYRETGKIRIYDEAGKKEYTGGLEYIKGRGNYSWASEEWTKKPFTIVLKKESSLLGQPSGFKYALIANASDDTLIRNDLARAVQAELELAYACRGSFSGLYINGEFMGIYYLCAPPDFGSERIDVNEAGADITGGYLMEREYVDRFSLEESDIACPVITDGEEHYVVYEPDYATEGQLEYLRDYMNKVESAIMSTEDGPEYERYIDVGSFAQTYLTEEIIKNYDAGVSSAYYYKLSEQDGGRLCCAPGWDYDMTLGSYQDWMGYDDPEGLTGLYPHDAACPWFARLQDRDLFRDRYLGIYRDRRDAVADILYGDRLKETRAALAGAYEAEYLRWKPMYDGRGAYPGSDEAYHKLTDFAERRMNYLDAVWITE